MLNYVHGVPDAAVDGNRFNRQREDALFEQVFVQKHLHLGQQELRRHDDQLGIPPLRRVPEFCFEGAGKANDTLEGRDHLMRHTRRQQPRHLTFVLGSGH